MINWIKTHKVATVIIALILVIGIGSSGTNRAAGDSENDNRASSEIVQTEGTAPDSASQSGQIADEENVASAESTTPPVSSLASLPTYSGEAYVVIDNDQPAFSESDLAQPFGTELYGDMDRLGRATVAFAIVGPETEPAAGEKRGSISDIKPTGWQQAFYKEELDLEHLYERSHLIAWRLTAENANPKNLITGTVYMNSYTMTQFEDLIDDYVDGTGGHVAMRVTPHYEGNNLVASGVQIEALSLEDNGNEVSLNVYCFNVQPDVEIDYATGASRVAASASEKPATEQTGSSSGSSSAGTASGSAVSGGAAAGATANAGGSGSSGGGSDVGASNASSSTAIQSSAHYVLNTHNMKFHKPNCHSAAEIAEKNRSEFDGDRSELVAMGYSPCGNCRP